VIPVAFPLHSNCLLNKVVNHRIVFSFKAIGKGLTSQECFCALMEMYSKHLNTILIAVCKVVDEECNHAATHLKSLYVELNDDSSNDVRDVHISINRTLMKPGFSSLHGCVFVISKETGNVLDFVVLSKYCKSCEIWEKRTKSTEEYNKWKTADSCGEVIQKNGGFGCCDALLMFSRKIRASVYKFYCRWR